MLLGLVLMTATKEPTQKTVFCLRVDHELLEQFRRIAKREDRSMNAEFTRAARRHLALEEADRA